MQAVCAIDSAADVDEARDAEAKAAFHLRMRARGIHDLAVLRAFERVPRGRFAPHIDRDLVARDLALPIACGQTLNEPWLVARMIVALAVDPSHRVLEIGTGTGYSTMVLAHLAAEVASLERCRSLALGAEALLPAFGIANATISWGDGLAPVSESAIYDRIIIHGVIADGQIGGLRSRLAKDGVIVAARSTALGQRVVAHLAQSDGSLSETSICGSRLQFIRPGLAAM